MGIKTSVGIDIGTKSIKIVQLKKDKSGIELEKYIIENLNARNPSELIKEIFKRENIKPKIVVTVISGEATNIRFISMPIMEEKGLRNALHWGGVPEYIPFDLKEFVWDVSITKWYRRQDEVAAGEKQHMDVLIIVARKDYIKEHLGIFKDIKIKPAIIDVSAIALSNFTCFNSRPSETLYWGIIDIGAKTTGINILEAETFKFNLEIQFGMENLINAVRDNSGITVEEADTLIREMDLSKLDSMDTVSNEKEKHILQICDNKLKELIKELNGAISFQEGKTPGKTISKLFLSGGGSKINNIDKFLRIRLNKEIVIENKLNHVAINYTKKDEDSLLSVLPLLNVAIGSALRGLTTPKTIVNLLPVEEIIGRKLQIQKIVVAAVISVLLFLFLSLAFTKIVSLIKVNKETSQIKEKISGLKSASEELLRMKDTLDRFDGFATNDIGIGKNSNKSWSGNLVEFTFCVPVGMWIERFDGVPRGGLTISGKVSKGKQDLIEVFTRNCSNSKNFKGTGIKDMIDSEEYTNFNMARREGTSAIPSGKTEVPHIP